MRARYLLALLLLFATLEVNSKETENEPAASASGRTPSTQGSSLSFGMPADGDKVPTTFLIKFHISGMGIAPAGSKIDNTGHHHLLIDLDQLPDFNNPLPASDHLVHFGKGQAETELSLPEGKHTLQLLFADYRHIPHEPVVISDKITITVSVDAPPQQEPED